jgi:hypothetical protein
VRAAAAAAAVIALAGAPAGAGGGPGPAASRGGPAVVVPDCRIENAGCGLDGASPDLDPAACAHTLSKLLGRRGVATALPGPAADACAADPRAVVLLGSVAASCPADPGGGPARDGAVRTVLHADLRMLDCASGETVGRSDAERAVESGRRTLLRDAVEELSHHLSERKVRRSHPETPLAWMRGDAGGEHAVEVRGGALDSERSDINGLFQATGLPDEDRAPRVAIEAAYNPWRAQRLRLGAGVEGLQIHGEGDGVFSRKLLNGALRDPNGFPLPFAPARVEAVFRAVGLVGSAAYGFDVTRHQRVSGRASLGYFVLGPGLGGEAEIRVTGTPAPLTARVEAASWGGAAEARWDWRFTPHLALSAALGWNHLAFTSPDRPGRARFLPWDVEFSGRSAQVGIAGRF